MLSTSRCLFVMAIVLAAANALQTKDRPLTRVWGEVEAQAEKDKEIEAKVDSQKTQIDTMEEKLNYLIKCWQPPYVEDGIASFNYDGNKIHASYACRQGYVHLRGTNTQSTCNDGVWDLVDMECTDYSKCYVYNSNIPGAIYTGNLRRTVTGRTCQSWTSQYPHSHGNTQNYKFQRVTQNRDTWYSAENFCRDPDNSKAPWCYTTSSSQRWEYCIVNPC